MAGGKLLSEALRYAGMGYAVIPVHGIQDGQCSCGRGAHCKAPGKHPKFPDWQKLATTDPEIIGDWPWQGSNIGIAPIDETIFDFDGIDGLRTLERMLVYLGDLPDGTPIAKTGSGGIHIFCKGRSKNSVRILPGLDIRSIGGQAVVPPSGHYSGAQYTWLQPPKGPPPELPSWLAVARGDIPQELQPPQIITLDDIRELAGRKGRLKPVLKAIVKGEVLAEPGERDITLTSLAGFLARRFPRAEPSQVATLLGASLALMQATQVDAPTAADFANKLVRFQQEERENLENRPRILIRSNLEEVAEEAIEALKRKEKRVFSRAGQLVKISSEETLPELCPRNGIPQQIEPIPLPVLTGILTTNADWRKINAQGEEISIVPPPKITEYLHTIGRWEGIKHLEGIVTGAVLRSDGTIFKGGGYDEFSGMFSVTPSEPLPNIPTAQAIEALALIVQDFPFTDGSHFSAWLAGVLTCIGRDAIAGPTPMFLVDANVRGAGKTLLANAGIMLPTGHSPRLAALGQDNEEDRKQITALAIAGARTILIDNVSGKFGTPKLCEALSLHSNVWSDRILGKSQTWSGPFVPTYWATGNNVRLSPDMARRICYIRLESPYEKPELRSGFAQPSLLAHILDNQKLLYHCGLAILHNYFQAGKPQPKEPLQPWGGFEAWSDLIRGALVWAGLPDPAATRGDIGVSDEDSDLGTSLVKGMQEFVATEGSQSPGQIAHILYKPAQTLSDLNRYALLKETLDIGCPRNSGNPNAGQIGRLLTRFRGRVFEGLALYKNRRVWYVRELEQ